MYKSSIVLLLWCGDVSVTLLRDVYIQKFYYKNNLLPKLNIKRSQWLSLNIKSKNWHKEKEKKKKKIQKKKHSHQIWQNQNLYNVHQSKYLYLYPSNRKGKWQINVRHILCTYKQEGDRLETSSFMYINTERERDMLYVVLCMHNTVVVCIQHIRNLKCVCQTLIPAGWHF